MFKANKRVLGCLWVTLLLLVGCAGPASQASGGRGAGEAPTPRASRTLVFIARDEPGNLSSGVIGTSSGTTFRIFNSTLAIRGADGTPGPQLLASLPTLNSDSWRTFPDGRMETTYRLKPNLTWHDGEPLTSADLVFAWQVRRHPVLAIRGGLPESLMDRVETPDPQTFVVQWSQPYPDADLMEGFLPLPKHALQGALADVRADTWANLPFWTRDYIGAGAFKVENWEPGASLDSVAFDGYVFGRPKVDRLRVIYMQDTNAVAANLLAGAAHLVADNTIRTQTGVLIKREWGPRNGGSVYFTPAFIRFAYFQLRPDVASPGDVADLRVRQAIAHAIDKQALADTLHEGQGIVAEAIVRRGSAEAVQVDRQLARFPYDPRRSQQLMEDAGMIRGGDGFFSNAGGARFAPEWRATLGGDSELQLGILVDGLRKIGMDARQSLLPRPFSSEARHTFPTMMNWSTTDQPDGWLTAHRLSSIPSAENRWTGSNSGGWRSPEYDALVNTFTTTLDRSQRSDLMVRMALRLGEQLPVLPLYYNLDVVAHLADLSGVRVLPDGSIGFNIHEWEMA